MSAGSLACNSHPPTGVIYVCPIIQTGVKTSSLTSLIEASNESVAALLK